MKHIPHILSFGQPDCVFRTHIHKYINKFVTKKNVILDIGIHIQSTQSIKTH